MTKKAPQVTELLHMAQRGDELALNELAASVYKNLRKIAGNHMKKERASHTLQPTALVNEAFIHLFQGKAVEWESRSHFYHVAANVMRHILVDHARQKNAKKRGDRAVQIVFDEQIHQPPMGGTDLVALDEALVRLAEIDPRAAKVVELRFFTGLTIEEIATLLDYSTKTAKRDWIKAKIWLMNAMKP